MIGVCFPMGKGMYRVVHIPEDEVVLNSREITPYLICVEVLKSETVSTVKDGSTSQKLSQGSYVAWGLHLCGRTRLGYLSGMETPWVLVGDVS
ncbi:putative 1-phosphatidylinositol 4-kinase [Helianthus anomalus]